MRRFIEGGYDVAMVARNEERLRRLEAEIGKGAWSFNVEIRPFKESW